MEHDVRRFIIEELQYAGDGELTNDYPLIENHVLDSLGIFQIVAWLEDRFRVEVLDQELTPENFGSIASIARLVESKRP